MSKPYQMPDDKIDQRAVVLLSGGMDSAVALCLAVDRFGRDNVLPISFDYGQRHKRELEAASKLTRQLTNAPHYIHFVGPTLFRGYGSALIPADKVDVPATTYAQMKQDYGASITVVPNRNMVFIAIAGAYAMANKCGWVYVGVHAEDARNWAYPDCTPEFTGAMSAALYVATEGKVRLCTPFQNMSKGEIVKVGLDLGAPFDMTVSCYTGETPACGTCPTCVERLAAFAANFVVDPIDYQVPMNTEAV